MNLSLQSNALAIGGWLFVFIVVLGSFSYLTTQPPKHTRLPLVQGCKLHLQSCSADLPDGGKIHFDISPKQPDPTKALHLVATFEQFVPESVHVSFEGVNMDMGYLEFDLKRKKNTSDLVIFRGDAGLFVCSYGVMNWAVLANVKIDDTVYEVPFEFESVYSAREKVL